MNIKRSLFNLLQFVLKKMESVIANRFAEEMPYNTESLDEIYEIADETQPKQ